jgi:hypothetical protein
MSALVPTPSSPNDDLPAMTIDALLKPDPVLFETARTDIAILRRDYILSVRALRDAAHPDDLHATQARLDHARTALLQAIAILDYARGDPT